MSKSKTCQCPEIRDEEWHLQDMEWNGKFFYFNSLIHFFFVPLRFGNRLQSLKAEIAEKGYHLVNSDLVLCQPAMFQGRLLMEIEDPQQYDASVEMFDNARILTRVYKGPYSKMRRAIEELKAFTQDRTQLSPAEVYCWYVTCPRCAREKGGHKTVLFARV